MSFINSGICLFYPSESKKLPKGYLYAKREDAGTGGEAGSVSGKKKEGEVWREGGREGRRDTGEKRETLAFCIFFPTIS